MLNKTFLGIDHPAIACRDTAAMIRWYCEVLGMQVIASNGQTPPTALVGYGGMVSIEIMPVKDDGPLPVDVPRNCQGLRHLALRVDDFAAARSHLEKHGVKLMFEPVAAVGGGTIASFRDVEGNELQIVQR